MDVDAVFVDKSCVRALPCCDAAAATAKGDETRLDPCCAEAIEEVCLSGDFILVEVCIS